MEFFIVALVIVVFAAGAALVVTRQRSASLARRFGPEYDRVVAEQGSRRAGESELRRLVQRSGSVELHELDPAARARYREEWRAAQLRFVDEPEQAVNAANDLVVHVMADRGYPAGDEAERTEMVVADHPDLAAHYRAAHEAQARGRRGDATLDEMRAGFRHYRDLFERLLGTDAVDAPAPDVEVPTAVTPSGGDVAGQPDTREPDGDDPVGDRESRPARREVVAFDDEYGEVGPEPRRTEAGDVR
jgi:hypothetical protein